MVSKTNVIQQKLYNALNFNLVPSFRQSPTGLHATAGKLATARIPQTNFYQGTAARGGTLSTPKTPATVGIQQHCRDPATNMKATSRMQASTGKA
jgi:hypothetical protein